MLEPRQGVWVLVGHRPSLGGTTPELLTRAPFLMQPPELFKMMYSEEENDEELPLSSFSGLALCSYCKSRNGSRISKTLHDVSRRKHFLGKHAA